MEHMRWTLPLLAEIDRLVGCFDAEPVGRFGASEDNKGIERMAAVRLGRSDMQEQVHLCRGPAGKRRR